MTEDKKNKFLRNSLWSFIMAFLGRMGGLLFVVIIARFLQPEKFGIYNLAISIILVFLIIIDAGINQTLIRFVSEQIGKNKKKAVAITHYLLKIKLTIIFSVAIMIALLAYPLAYYIFNKPALFAPLMVSCIYLILSSLASFYHSFFYIIEKVQYLTVKQLIYDILRILGVLVIFNFIDSPLRIVATILVLIFASIIVLFYIFYTLKKQIPFIFENSDEPIDKTRIINFLKYVGGLGAFLVVFGYVDTIIVAFFVNAEYVGFYAAAIAITAGFAAILNLSNILLPIFTKMHKDNIEKPFNLVFRYTSIITIPAIFGLLVLGKYIIRLVYGYEYLPAVLPLYFLTIFIFVQPIISELSSLFSAREKPKYVLRTISIASAINIILDFILIYFLLRISMQWAIAGAAIASVISQIIYLITLTYYANKKLGVKIKFSELIKPTISAIIMAGILLTINSFIELGLFIGFLEVILGALIYFTVMFLINGIKKEDIAFLKNLRHLNLFK
jgi:O-antigen/teichoic acid export membrane protein